jgi:diguanylate cyclase (GGDEF)-like protein
MEDDARTAGIQQEDSEFLGGIRGDRDRSAENRDHRAEAHDETSDARDARSNARDERAEAREQTAGGVADMGAAADRAGALRDRLEAAGDRTQAADDREAAAADRALSAQEREISSVDELTGAYRRDAGTLELERETARAKRTNRPLVLAFVDVDGLKATNDSLGHAAGDQLLRQVVEACRACFRSYDLIVRYGGDEFVCSLMDLSFGQAAKRFSFIETDLSAAHQASISVGLAELEQDDSLEDLIERADEALYKERNQHPVHGNVRTTHHVHLP